MPAKNDIFLAVLIGEFWISGLFILSVIFLEIDNLDNLTLFTFISYSVGSFSAGILSDLIGRKPLFLFFSLLLFGGSIVLFWNLTAGFIIANLSIGPLNNLTFVFINENDRANSEINTIGVLLGWAASEITLGIMFLVLEDKNIFFYILSALTLIYAIAALIYT
jgi:MFS family permease